MAKKPQQLAKLSRPRLHGAVARERLFEKLDALRAHSAVWIAGPPGAGKTILAASYLDARKVGGIWYHVDPGDADPSTFFYYLNEAAGALAPRRQPLPLLTPEYLLDIEGFARRYFRELLSRFPQPGALVLDNFHEVPADSPLQQVMMVALGEVPHGINIVIISRGEPPDRFSRALATEAMVRIGWEDLKLTIEEAEAIASAKGMANRQTAHSLHERTGGWAAGLMLMLERLRRGLPGKDPEAESHQAVFDYFASEIFEEASAENQLIMLKTSLFAAFSAELAREMTGNRDVSRLLDHLCDRQLFTYRRGADSPRYEYHDLFREFLLRRARSFFPADEFRSLLLRAAALNEAFGQAEDAFPLQVEAQDWEGATRVVLASAPGLLAQGRWKTLEEWVRALPQHVVAGNPWLFYWLGNALIRTRPRHAREVLLPAFELFRKLDDPLGQTLAVSALVESIYFEWSDFSLLDPWIPVLEGLLQRKPQFPSVQSEARAVCGFFLALLFRQPRHPDMRLYAGRIEALLDEIPDPNSKMTAALALLQHCLFCADLRAGARLIDKISPLLESQKVAPLNKVFWWSRCGYFRFLCVDYESGHSALDRADALAEAYGLGFTEMLTAFVRMLLHLPDEHDRDFEPLVRRIEAIAKPASRLDAVYLNYALGLLAFKKRDMEEAVRRHRAAAELSGALGVIWYEAVFNYPLVAALIELKRFDDALDCLAKTEGLISGTAFGVYRIEAQFFRTYMAAQGHEQKEAIEALRHLLAASKDAEYVYTFRGHRAQWSLLFAMALDHGIETDYVESIVRKHRLPPPTAKAAGNWPRPVKIFALGEFRVEVDGKPLAFGRKAPKKPLAVLKAIIAFGGRSIPEQKLLDALWPGEDGDAAREAFAVSLHRLRKLLVHPDIVQLAEGLVSLDSKNCWVDAWALEQRIAEGERRPTGGLTGTDGVWEIYRGHFLAEDTEASWTLSMRERLRSQFLRHVARTGRQHEDAGKLDIAVQLYQKGVDTDDLAEELYQGLMRCHMKLDRRAEAMSVYRRLRQTLSVTLGIQPSAQSEQLFKTLKGE